MTLFGRSRRGPCAAVHMAALALGCIALGPAAGAQSRKPPPAAAASASPTDMNPALRSPLLSSRVMNGAEAHVQPRAQDWRLPDADNLLVIDTNKGRIIVELAPVAAPVSVERVKTLARRHFYDGQIFFRVIDAFMAQTGDPKNNGEGGSTLPNVKGEFTFRRDAAAPFVPVAWPSAGLVGFIGSLPVGSQSDALMGMTNDGKVSAWGMFCPGVVGMARASEPDSANSQFFLMRQAYPSLQTQYTTLGRVVAGLDVVRAIKVGEPVEAPADRMVSVRLASDLPPAERPVVRVLSPSSPAFRDIADRVRIDRGSEASICDIDIPAEVAPAPARAP